MPVFFLGLFGHASGVPALERSHDVEGLLHVLTREKDHAQKIAAAEALGRIGDDRAVSSLIPVLLHDDEAARAFAAMALGKIGDDKAVKPLVATLVDHHHMVRAAAARALGEMRDPRAVDFLNLMLADPYEEVRHAAREALDNISVDDVDLTGFEAR